MLRYTNSIVTALALFTIENAVFALPSGWSSLGCWTDNPGLRSLDAASYVDPVFSTIENCIQFCAERNYPLAGAEFGRECYCDTSIHNDATQANLTDCNFACPNNTAEICGGSARLSLFTNLNATNPPSTPTTTSAPTTPTPTPTPTPTGPPPPSVPEQFSEGLPGVWNLVGSFNNTTPNSQPFVVEAVIAGTKTTSGSVENCLTWCTVNLGCALCSISDGGVCECGNTLSPNRISTSPGTALCSLNSTEICGDHGVWQVYEFTANTGAA